MESCVAKQQYLLKQKQEEMKKIALSLESVQNYVTKEKYCKYYYNTRQTSKYSNKKLKLNNKET